MQYWGFDLGDGESTLARVSSEGKSYPEIVEVEGNKVIASAITPRVRPQRPCAALPASSGAF